MRIRLWPASLLGRVTLILFLGLAAAHVLSFWLVVMERSLVMRGAMVSYMARDVASSVAMLERLPAAERAAWLPRLARQNYSFRLSAPTDGKPSQAMLAEPIVRAVSSALEPTRDVMAQAPDLPGSLLRLQLRLSDGARLTVDLAEPRLAISPWVLGVLAAQLALLAGLSWLAVRLATRPLRQLADAADALGTAKQGPPLPEDGPHEVARATTAFNAMQQRIQAHLTERMQILAAVSHDLQTPITRLRLRADLLDDVFLRAKLLADLADMQSLVEEGLAYARSANAAMEPLRQVDMNALLDSLVCDYTDSGQQVALTGDAPGMLHTRPQALRRLVVNLVDNALKFAGDAEIAVKCDAGSVCITVLDRGPGIPDSELDAVTLPFYRLENSRSRATGGTGLGLAIARQLAQTLGADLTLANRDGGGLAVGITLVTQAGDA
jgi:signal transduction histidine kinase